MIPNWFYIALLPPLIWATNYHIDKIVITRWGKGVSNVQFAIISGLGGLLAVALIILLDPTRLQGGWIIGQILPTFFGGFAYFIALYFYYVAISREEVTRVSSLYSLTPIFGIVLGVGLIGEQISIKQLIGILIVVTGALLVDIRVVKHMLKINLSVLLLMLWSCAFFTLGSVGFKQSSITLEIGDNFLWFFVGSIVMTLILLVKRSYRQEFHRLFDHKRSWLIPGLVASNVSGMIGRAFYNYAILLAPIAFIQTVGAFESTFVLLIAYVLWKLFRGLEPEDLSKRVLQQKVISIAIITTGSLLLL